MPLAAALAMNRRTRSSPTRPRADEEAAAHREHERRLRPRLDRADALPGALDAAADGGVERAAARDLEVGVAGAVEDLGEPSSSAVGIAPASGSCERTRMEVSTSLGTTRDHSSGPTAGATGRTRSAREATQMRSRYSGGAERLTGPAPVANRPLFTARPSVRSKRRAARPRTSVSRSPPSRCSPPDLRSSDGRIVRSHAGIGLDPPADSRHRRIVIELAPAPRDVRRDTDESQSRPVVARRRRHTQRCASRRTRRPLDLAATARGAAADASAIVATS